MNEEERMKARKALEYLRRKQLEEREFFKKKRERRRIRGVVSDLLPDFNIFWPDDPGFKSVLQTIDEADYKVQAYRDAHIDWDEELKTLPRKP